MDLFEAVARRYSYRGPFTDAAVPRDDLRKIVQAGIQAPSACNEQVAQFVVVDDPKLLAGIAEIVGRPVCETARAMIVCLTDNRPVFKEFAFPIEDSAAAVENMLLAATALGYASVWLDGVLKVHDVAERIGRLLGVPEEFTVRVLLPLGVAANPGVQRDRLPFEKRAWFNGYAAGSGQ
ncbi:MAG TPA: nitroreductase family protein [Thermoguttaceae bacterium]|nr:nitroreductase family protein [Thermoguttaceae bacterium]